MHFQCRNKNVARLRLCCQIKAKYSLEKSVSEVKILSKGKLIKKNFFKSSGLAKVETEIRDITCFLNQRNFTIKEKEVKVIGSNFHQKSRLW